MGRKCAKKQLSNKTSWMLSLSTNRHTQRLRASTHLNNGKFYNSRHQGKKSTLSYPAQVEQGSLSTSRLFFSAAWRSDSLPKRPTRNRFSISCISIDTGCCRRTPAVVAHAPPRPHKTLRPPLCPSDPMKPAHRRVVLSIALRPLQPRTPLARHPCAHTDPVKGFDRPRIEPRRAPSAKRRCNR